MSGPPRIGVLTTSYPRHPQDPSGHFVRGLCHELARHGARLEVLAAAGPGESPAGETAEAREESGSDRIRVERVRYAPSHWQRLFYTGGAPEALEAGGAAWLQAGLFQAAQLLATARRARHWQALVSHWLLPSALSGTLGSWVAPRPGPARHLAIAHSGDVALADRLGLLPALLSLLTGRGVQLAFVSAALRERALVSLPPDGTATRERTRRGVQTALLTPMGVSPEEVPGAPAALVLRQDTRARLGIAASSPVGLILGRLSPVKGVDVALAALTAMTVRPFVLLVAGDGPERAGLQAHAAGLVRPAGVEVRFLGEIAPSYRWALLCAADLLLVPSRHLPDRRGAGGRTEGSPTVVAEAALVGLPVVASAVGGLPERVVDGGTGLLVPPDEPAALATALDRLAGSAALRRRMGEAGQGRAAELLWPRAAAPLVAALGLADPTAAPGGGWVASAAGRL